MYIYVPSKTSNAGIDFARPDENSSCASSLVCLAMTSSREICPKPKLCGTKSLIRERLAEETALRTYKNNKIYISKVVSYIYSVNSLDRLLLK